MALSPNVTMQQKRGNKANLPSFAPDGQLLIAKDTKELFFGTGTGISQIGSDTSLIQTKYVAPSGSDTTGNGSLTKPFATISAAMNSITDASFSKRYAIQLAPGSYLETTIAIKPNVFILGEGLVTRLTCTSITLHTSWNQTGDNRCGFKSLSLVVTQENTSNGHNSPYGIVADFQTKGSSEGKMYFEDVVIFGTLYANGNTNQINQLWFKNSYFYKAITFDGVKSYHSENTYFSTVKGIGTRSIFYVNSFPPKWKVDLQNGSTIDYGSNDAYGLGYAAENTMLLKYSMSESKNNVSQMLDEFSLQHYNNFFNIYMNAQKALRSYAIDEAQRQNFNKVYFDDYTVFDGTEAVASGGAQLYYGYGARGSETDNNGKITSPTIIGFPTTATTCILMGTPTLGDPDITFEYSRNNGTSWTNIPLDTLTNIPSGSSFKIRVNLKAWSWNFGWALLFNSTV
jgi:hypothetical protein